MRRGRRGFSLVELLVCVAIIGVLASLYLSTLSKARRKAEEVVVVAGLRNDYIGREADIANVARPRNEAVDDDTIREHCRAAFRKPMKTSEGDVLITQLLFAVENEAEFRAYWHSLINPDANWDLDGNLGSQVTVRDEAGNEYTLSSIDRWRGGHGAPVPEGWEFISTDLSETTSGTLGATVIYTDGHADYISYPHQYPACRTVAELSHRFVQETG